MAVGFWNFVGAGVFGMLAMALLVLCLRHVLSDEQWAVPEKWVTLSFWGMNAGLALMVIAAGLTWLKIGKPGRVGA